MKKLLMSNKRIGAVCSLVRVINKNKNIITRLQALEYHAFNITKIADNTFLKGPLVMQGMLTGFKTKALLQVNGFSEGHLIEDYDITTRLKTNNWDVQICKNAQAWTYVPDNVSSLWKQRVRWTYGGVEVVTNSYKNILPIFQDFLGHILFLSLLILILLSIILRTESPIPQTQYTILLITALTLFVISNNKLQ
jgi:cellulose synthase/poly-beta-1,6-N-acetylglucosamine synthase-like glycosyltransferase